MKLFKRRETAKISLNLANVNIAPFDKSVVLNRFDCGKTPLNRFLKNKAKKSVLRNEHKVFVACTDGSRSCIGYYALQLGADSVPNLPGADQSYLQNYSAFPAVHLSFLGVDQTVQRQGLGQYLLMDVFEKVANISEYAGFYALTLQSFDADSTEFYKSLGFEQYSEGGGQPKMLFPLSNILQAVGKA